MCLSVRCGAKLLTSGSSLVVAGVEVEGDTNDAAFDEPEVVWGQSSMDFGTYEEVPYEGGCHQ